MSDENKLAELEAYFNAMDSAAFAEYSARLHAEAKQKILDAEPNKYIAEMELVNRKPIKFRKKPVIVEASQWFCMGHHPMVVPHPNAQARLEGYGWINTLEGGQTVTPGDWIITGTKGEHYPLKPDIFEAIYEPVDNP